MFKIHRFVKCERHMSFNNKNSFKTPVLLFKGGFCGNNNFNITFKYLK